MRGHSGRRLNRVVGVLRGEFERLVRRAFDPVLTPHGFSLSPQLPAEVVFGRRAVAVYEATPRDFVQRFPTWSRHWSFEEPLELGCVDVWVKADLATNDVLAEWEGLGTRHLAEMAGVTGDERVVGPPSLEEALAREADLCRRVLSLHAGT